MRLVEVETPVPSPFAAAPSSATWVPSCMRATAWPSAVRPPSVGHHTARGTAWRVELRELLDPDIVRRPHQLQHLPEDRQAKMPKVLPTYRGLLARSRPTKSPRDRPWLMPPWLVQLHALQAGIAGRLRGSNLVGRDRGTSPAARDAVGVSGVGWAFPPACRGGSRPPGEPLGRYAGTRGPFSTRSASRRTIRPRTSRCR